jgi:8-oxo-dGTP diphosphatase
MMIDVVAAILEDQTGKFLIAKRKTGKKLAGYWEFPGGKIENGESPQQSLIRELYEEMNLEIKIGDYVGENIHFYDEGPIRLLAYKGKITGGEIKLTDHEEYAWINLLDLKKVKLAPADIPFIELLVNGSGMDTI